MWKHLYLQVYAVVLGSLVLFALMLGGAFWYMDHDDEHERWLRDLTHFAEAVVPPADASRERLDRWAGAFAKPLRLDLAVYAADGTELARAGGPVPPPPAEGPSRWIAEHGRRRTIALALDDGRWIVASGRPPRRPRPGSICRRPRCGRH